MTHIQKHLEILGHTVKDKVTGLEGVVTSLAFDLFGCIQVVITPDCKSSNSASWVDISRIQVLSDFHVMPIPDFSKGYIAEGLKGPAHKPI